MLLDLNMPVMDGFAFLHDLREKPGCADLPVIVFSARDLSSSDRERLKEAHRVVEQDGQPERLDGTALGAVEAACAHLSAIARLRS